MQLIIRDLIYRSPLNNNTGVEYLVNHTYYYIVIYSFHLVFYANICIYSKYGINNNQ